MLFVILILLHNCYTMAFNDLSMIYSKQDKSKTLITTLLNGKRVTYLEESNQERIERKAIEKRLSDRAEQMKKLKNK